MGGWFCRRKVDGHQKQDKWGWSDHIPGGPPHRTPRPQNKKREATSCREAGGTEWETFLRGRLLVSRFRDCPHAYNLPCLPAFNECLLIETKTAPDKELKYLHPNRAHVFSRKMTPGVYF